MKKHRLRPSVLIAFIATCVFVTPLITPAILCAAPLEDEVNQGGRIDEGSTLKTYSGLTIQQHDGLGIKVVRVEPGSPAQKAGVRAGDIICEIGTNSFYGFNVDPKEFESHVLALPEGKEQPLLIERNGRMIVSQIAFARPTVIDTPVSAMRGMEKPVQDSRDSVTHGKQGDFRSSAATRLSVSVQTSKDTYIAGVDKEGIVSGRVTCEGRGIAGSKVSIQVTYSHGSLGSWEVTTDNQGRFSKTIPVGKWPDGFKNPVAYTVKVIASKGNYRNGSGNANFTIKLRLLSVSVTTDRKTYRPNDFIVVSGNVTSDGKPVPYAGLALGLDTGYADPNAYKEVGEPGIINLSTDINGQFSRKLRLACDARAGVHRLWVTAEKNGYLDVSKASTEVTVETDKLSVSVTTDKNTYVPRLESIEISGRVTFQDKGVPLADVLLEYYQWGETTSQNRYVQWKISTDDEGRFKKTFAQGLPEQPYEVTAKASKCGYEPGNAETRFKVEKGDLRITLACDKSAYMPKEFITISGTVTNKEGEPVSSARVSITHYYPKQSGNPNGYPDTHDPGRRSDYEKAGKPAIVPTNEQGGFSRGFRLKEDIPEGVHYVAAKADKEAYRESVSKHIGFTVEGGIKAQLFVPGCPSPSHGKFFKRGDEKNHETYYEVNGKKQGPFVKIENGVKSKTGCYCDGKRCGLWTYFFNDGERKLKTENWKDDKLDGIVTKFDGSLVGYKTFERSYKQGKRHGMSTFYYENSSTIKEQREYKNDELDGVYRLLNENGDEYFLEHYKNGLLHGLKRIKKKDTLKTLVEINYADGKLHGEKREYHREGWLKCVRQYQNDRMHSAVCYDKNGTPESEFKLGIGWRRP